MVSNASGFSAVLQVTRQLFEGVGGNRSHALVATVACRTPAGVLTSTSSRVGVLDLRPPKFAGATLPSLVWNAEEDAWLATEATIGNISVEWTVVADSAEAVQVCVTHNESEPCGVELQTLAGNVGSTTLTQLALVEQSASSIRFEISFAVFDAFEQITSQQARRVGGRGGSL